MIPVLAHNPELMLLWLSGAAIIAMVAPTVVYTVLSALGFMLAGIGLNVSWWRRLLAPAVSALLCALLSLAVVVGKLVESAASVSVSWGALLGAVLFLFPVFHCRFFLQFSWLRSALAACIIVLLHLVFFVLLVTLLAYCFPQSVQVA